MRESPTPQKSCGIPKIVVPSLSPENLEREVPDGA